ncbi:MAP9 protein, partial [Xiphorhynchus elegans]|nr:MAP9 protein [Xiphorhynchus elegans]
DQETVNTSDLKLEDSGRKSPVVEQMMTTVPEKAKELENPAADCSDGTVTIVEGQIITDTMQEVSVNDESEHGEARNVSKNSVKEHYLVSATINGKIIIVFVSWYFHRSLSSVHLKKKAKPVPSAAPVSSQYLGTLKVLEDKCMQKKRTEFDKADSLRAAVFQNWLEKKRRFLMELKRTEKEKAENLRNDTERKEALKKEESTASFEAWKKKKAREAKKLNEKKKLEELEEKKPAEQNKEKAEAAQKYKISLLTQFSWSEVQHLVCYIMISCYSLSLYRNEKKEEYIKKKKVEKFLERKKQEMRQVQKEEKNEKAMEEYERWLENKERREHLEKKQKKLQAVHGNEMSPPWRPPGKVTYSGNY